MQERMSTATLSKASPLSVTPGVAPSGIDASLRARLAKKRSSLLPLRKSDLGRSGGRGASPLKDAGRNPSTGRNLMGSKLVVSGGSAPVRVACSQAACQGSIELVVQTGVRRGEGRRHQDKSALGRDRETVMLATGSFSLAEGQGRGRLAAPYARGQAENSLTRAITRSPPCSSCP
jgi:hypothetical protein